jgi:nifR3 family TIM-barrel protein
VAADQRDQSHDTDPQAPGIAFGSVSVDPPVVLAPMAGVTNAPFRRLCRSFGGGLYVGEMVTARALVEGHAKSWELARFASDESPRSLQLYGVDPAVMSEAVRRLVDRGIDHIDLNFGCPVPKVTRLGGGAALPVRRRLLAGILAAAVEAAGPVPVTAKFRMGVDDAHLNYLETGRIAEEQGCAAIALHARTAEQRYSGSAHWDAIAALKAHVRSIPVLGNGDIWEADDAIAMLRHTGCDGVVIGRGCLGRPWLFRDLAERLAGRPVAPPPRLGEVATVMIRHLRMLAEWRGETHAAKDFRKHTGWYMTGYPVGSDVRRRLSAVQSIAELSAILDGCNPLAELVAGGSRLRRGHTHGPSPVAVPDGWYGLADAEDAIDPDAELAGSGG